ncbi:MAG: DUF4892 domain-containing protein [Oleiphilaceae bacterium]|nr:DUF4892 domain-containing protein [Oleiphilaceae bacterium]
MLSPVREISNRIRSDTMVRLAVDGIGQLMQVNADSSRAEAREYYLSELKARDATILYRCEGRSCGRSNVWANQIFEQATLYGRDTDQDYLVAAYQGANDKTRLVLVYTVTRGNNREHVWVEQLNVADASKLPGFSGGSSRIRGPIIVPWTGGVTFQFDYNANDRGRLQEWMSEPGSELVLNSFSTLGDDQSLESALEQARQAADSLTDLLAQSVVSEDRVTKIVIGPVITFENPARQGNRVEIKVVSQP